jgi:hypothetical protein
VSGKLSDVQRRWQEAALSVLLCEAGTYGRGPWIPAGEVVAATQNATGCTTQAATGALRSLLMVGLADRCQTSEGAFWKATDAAQRFDELLSNETEPSRG